jgi:hypothetical protein
MNLETINSCSNYDELTKALDEANRKLFFANNGSGKLPNLTLPKVCIDGKDVVVSVDYNSGCINLGAANQ